DTPRLLCLLFIYPPGAPRHLHSFPTRRSSDLVAPTTAAAPGPSADAAAEAPKAAVRLGVVDRREAVLVDRRSVACSRSDLLSERSEEHTSELQSRGHLVCRLLLEKKKQKVSHT